MKYLTAFSRSLPAAFLAAILLSVPAAEGQDRTVRRSPTCYESEGRDRWQLPDSVVSALKLAKGQVVADLGSSTGYFTLALSRATGSTGRVLAVDIDTEALAILAGLAERENLANIGIVHATADDSRLPPGSCDLIFICNTLHHIGNRAEYLRRLKRALKPKGRVAVVDFFKKDIPVGPRSASHKLSKEEAKTAFLEAGYRITGEHNFLPYQYFFIAEP
ncbi:MAG TPA: methyltransferase domain-containing protein [archaeon]|nr:methyltransferase domain-containing protein [archaeon]